VPQPPVFFIKTPSLGTLLTKLMTQTQPWHS